MMSSKQKERERETEKDNERRTVGRLQAEIAIVSRSL